MSYDCDCSICNIIVIYWFLNKKLTDNIYYTMPSFPTCIYINIPSKNEPFLPNLLFTKYSEWPKKVNTAYRVFLKLLHVTEASKKGIAAKSCTWENHMFWIDYLCQQTTVLVDLAFSSKFLWQSQNSLKKFL